jgi:hypothetical protein
MKLLFEVGIQTINRILFQDFDSTPSKGGFYTLEYLKWDKKVNSRLHLKDLKTFLFTKTFFIVLCE